MRKVCKAHSGWMDKRNPHLKWVTTPQEQQRRQKKSREKKIKEKTFRSVLCLFSFIDIFAKKLYCSLNINSLVVACLLFAQ